MPNWKRHDGSSLPDASDGYATGFIAWVLQKSGILASDPRLRRSLTWLEANQSHWNGRWSTESLNRHHGFWEESGHFMDDAATAFAVLALVRSTGGALAQTTPTRDIDPPEKHFRDIQRSTVSRRLTMPVTPWVLALPEKPR
jgi:hypothetical protein